MNFVPENIVWIYAFQPICSELQKMNKKIKFVKWLILEDKNLIPPNQKHLIILDDVFQDWPSWSSNFFLLSTHDVDSKCFTRVNTGTPLVWTVINV